MAYKIKKGLSIRSTSSMDSKKQRMFSLKEMRFRELDAEFSRQTKQLRELVASLKRLRIK
jgi:hypothetical protein